MQKLIAEDIFEIVLLAGVDGQPINAVNPMPVQVIGQGADRELVVTTFLCKNAFTGASVGDTITSTQIIDVSGTPSTVSVVWRNQSTAVDLATSPSGANLELVGSQALTDGQIRATPLAISAASLPLPAGAATSADMTAINSTLGTPMQQTGATVGLVAGAATIGSVNVLGGNATAVKVDNSAVTQPVSIATTVEVSGPLTDVQLRASVIPVSIAATLPVSGPLTDTQLRAAEVPVSIAATVPVSGPLTDTQLRALSVPVSAASLPLPAGAATESTLAAVSAKLPATMGQKTAALSLSVVLASDNPTVPVSGPLTDVQLRASVIPVSIASTVPVSGPLTDTQLRASALPVSLPALTTAAEVFSTETGAFTIAAGAISYSVVNTGASSFVFQGETIPTSVFEISGAPLRDKTYPAIVGDATGTTVIVQRTA